jgi:hypothetical protein
MDVRAGTPVAIAAFAGRLHVRGGATCRPALVVRVGSGEERVAGGAEAAWREVYVMSEPGSYEVTATRTSRCPSNYDYIGGGDPPYEDSVSIEVTVRA